MQSRHKKTPNSAITFKKFTSEFFKADIYATSFTPIKTIKSYSSMITIRCGVCNETSNISIFDYIVKDCRCLHCVNTDEYVSWYGKILQERQNKIDLEKQKWNEKKEIEQKVNEFIINLWKHHNLRILEYDEWVKKTKYYNGISFLFNDNKIPLLTTEEEYEKYKVEKKKYEVEQISFFKDSILWYGASLWFGKHILTDDEELEFQKLENLKIEHSYKWDTIDKQQEVVFSIVDDRKKRKEKRELKQIQDEDEIQKAERNERWKKMIIDRDEKYNWNNDKVMMRFIPNEYASSIKIIYEIQGAESLIEITCGTCENIYISTVNEYYNLGRRCPSCTKRFSKGEEIVMRYLDKNRIQYYTQYKFDTCRYINPLPFDFYLWTKEKLIEFQGEQHYRHVNWSGNLSNEQLEYNLQINKIRDNIKRQWCLDNNKELLCIPYDAPNVAMLLYNFI